VKIKPRNEILGDIIRDAKKYPKDWVATLGNDKRFGSKDSYIFHPKSGVYLLKEYSKNPFLTKGVGAKIARHVDDDILNTIEKNRVGFGIIQGDIGKIFRNIQNGVQPERIFNAALSGEDLGLKIPVKGSASTSKEIFNNMNNCLSSSQVKLDESLRKMIKEDRIYDSYQ